MSIPGSVNPLFLSSAAAAGGFQVSRSLIYRAPNPLPSKDDVVRQYDYNPENGLFTRQQVRIKPGTIVTTANGTGYIVLQVNKKLWLGHRIAWMLIHNEDPGDRQIDHINRCRADNRIENLRIAVNSENHFNMKVRSDSSSGVKGVQLRRDTGRWMARIKKHGKFIALGCFDTKEEAQIAYDTAALKYFGEHAATNAQLQEAIV